MPAKKSAPKPAAKAKKAPSRPAPVTARKAVAARKPAEKAKASPPPKAKAAATAARKSGLSSLPDGARKTPNPSPTAVPAPRAHAAEPAGHAEIAPGKTQAPPATRAAVDTPSPIASRIPTLQTDSDDNDAIEPGSLLAGPRNVQPYIVKRGEQYMGKEQSEHFRLILQNWKRDLMEEVDRTVTHMKDEAANFPDPNDRATQEEEFSLELRTRDRERKLIRKIEEAIKRIDDGSYGYCLETGEEIGIKRLEARPVATLSLEAQERRERRERQYGDRDDRYR